MRLYRRLTDRELDELRGAFLLDRVRSADKGNRMTVAFCDDRIACIDAEVARRTRRASGEP